MDEGAGDFVQPDRYEAASRQSSINSVEFNLNVCTFNNGQNTEIQFREILHLSPLSKATEARTNSSSHLPSTSVW